MNFTFCFAAKIDIIVGYEVESLIKATTVNELVSWPQFYIHHWNFFAARL